uniref:Ig-like domain-containing protein n=1 Tax=Cyclopterus lumpus TaxID=8103 RepID=A0A8C2ZSX4_CYCLU
MRQPLLLLSLSLAVLLSANVLAQNQIEIQFQTDPVLVQTGAEIVFTVLTVSQVFSMTWQYQGGVTVGQWSGGSQTINTGTQFQDRITITNTQLRIVGAQLRDAGKFTVVVTPTATTGLVTNSRSIQLRVFDAVATVTLLVPSVAVEARNVSLRCTWTGGTDITVRWGKGGAAILADDRITISAGSLVINPARRSDAGEYTCTVSNPISAQTATESLTVYYGPDIPVLTKVSPKECVGGGDVLVGQTVRLTCVSDSLPPALFSWQRDGQPVASVQPDSGVLSLQTFSTDESGPYVCTARNGLTGGTSQQGVDLAIVATCLDVGEVVGIVIGCLLLILIIVLLIVLIVCLARRRRAQQRQSDTSVKTNPNPGPIPPDPQPNGARDLGHGPHPPLYHLNTHTHHPDRIYAAPPESRGNPQTLQLNGAHMALQHRAVLIQTPPQGPGKLTHPVTNGANQPRQGGTAPVPQSSAQLNPSTCSCSCSSARTDSSSCYPPRTVPGPPQEAAQIPNERSSASQTSCQHTGGSTSRTSSAAARQPSPPS